VVADPNNEDMLDRLAFDLGAEFLSDMLHTLSEPEKFVVEHYYGITTKEPITLHAIGQIRGISRERVRQIHNRAIVKLRINSLGSPARSTA
jgi:RNA polymerase primary sigma factor